MEVDLMLQSANSSASLMNTAAAGAIAANNAASSAMLNDLPADESLQATGASFVLFDFLAFVIVVFVCFLILYTFIGMFYYIAREVCGDAMLRTTPTLQLEDRPEGCVIFAWPLIFLSDIGVVGRAIAANLSRWFNGANCDD